jgi:hypothetical protein
MGLEYSLRGWLLLFKLSMNTVYKGSTGDWKLLQEKLAGESSRTEDVE